MAKNREFQGNIKAAAAGTKQIFPWIPGFFLLFLQKGQKFYNS